MESDTYKAAIFRGAGRVDVVALPFPKCGDDEVIVRNLMTGVCGSDIAAYRRGGDLNMIWKDHEFGHEAVSEVVQIGKDVKGLTLGDHIFPHLGYALRDRNRMSTVGGFSEYIKILQCEVGYSLFKIDAGIPIKTAVLVEPFVIGARGARNTNPGPDKSAIVFGAGIIGMSAAIMLDWFGCSKVMIVDISEPRLENARKLGLVTCNPEKEDLKAKALAELGSHAGQGGERCNATIYLDAIGLKPAIDNFIMLAGRDSTLAIVGAHHEPVALNLRQVSLMNWKIMGCGSTSTQDAIVDVLAMMRSNKYQLSSLVTHEYPIEQINDALVMGANAQEAQKVVINFEAA
jgi:threonine dehydrogenase-like Zn-dependent dehydrogenase